MSDAPAGCRVFVWLRRGYGALAHLAAWGMTAFLLLLSRPGTSAGFWVLVQLFLFYAFGLFSWHPVFMSIAFCLCLTEAILTFSPEGSLFFCSHKVKVQLHWIAEMLSLMAATLGLVFIISSKNRSELPHFISWHSILGLLTILATCGQVLCGLGLLFPQLLRISLVAQLQRCHTVYRLIVYLLATSTVVLGICSDWFQAQIKGVAWYLCLGLIFCPALVIVNQTSRTCLPKKRLYV